MILFLCNTNSILFDAKKYSVLMTTKCFTLLGLALIAMGISLMQEQVTGKMKWCMSEMGLKETKEDSFEKYTIKKHYGIVATPQNQNNNQLGIYQG